MVVTFRPICNYSDESPVIQLKDVIIGEHVNTLNNFNGIFFTLKDLKAQFKKKNEKSSHYFQK